MTAHSPERQPIIDCDVHPNLGSPAAIQRYLPARWHKHYFYTGRPYYNHPNHVLRLDAVTPDGGVPGSDPAFLREHHLEPYGIDYAILLPLSYCSLWPNPDMAADLAHAFNEWQAEVWLGASNQDGRCKGSIVVAPQDPLKAAAEIDLWANHPHMVQVFLESGANNVGRREYRPILEACNRHGLPLALHPTSEALGVNTPASHSSPTTYMEWSVGLTLSIQSHLISLITEGAFERYPRLRVVLVEGGAQWLPALLWRLDASWKGLRDEVPWVKKLPSEYVRDRVRLTSQPLNSPAKTEHVLMNLEMMNASEVLMFASDYPHWDFDSPTQAFPRLPDDMRRRIFYENAKSLYNL
ncbi:amidohydrolase [Alicyclobacillus tolerans]|uniref:amidohydrolase family protein n=1 Tax=Alicyclobacillus tolerans TaxID=90970 RepID=UPI001F470AFC|nr:amidohydrolase family protein [Alicyclobacillus tolerans]MCF8566799.1 amidohydrolase [Alicyclobacillus tolerans]